MKTFYVISLYPTYNFNDSNHNDITIHKLKAKDIDQVKECIGDSIAINDSSDFILTPKDYRRLVTQIEKNNKKEAEDISKIYG